MLLPLQRTAELEPLQWQRSLGSSSCATQIGSSMLCPSREVQRKACKKHFNFRSCIHVVSCIVFVSSITCRCDDCSFLLAILLRKINSEPASLAQEGTLMELSNTKGLGRKRLLPPTLPSSAVRRSTTGTSFLEQPLIARSCQTN